MADGKVVIKATLDASDAQSGISKLKGLLGGLQQTGSRVGSVFKSVLGANLVSSALTSGLSAVSSGVRGIIDNLNDSTAAWASFEGNMKNIGVGEAEIRKVSASLQDYAKKTIYSSSEMASTYAQLRATGVKGTEDLVKAFGNLAGSAENPAQAMKTLSQQATQMTANSKVQFADFRIMAQQAPSAMAEVAKKMGMSYGELTTAIKDGKVATTDFFEAVKQAGAAGSVFEDMATKPKTFSQALDTLVDGISNKLLPHFGKLNQAGIDFITGISDAVENLNFDAIFTKIDGVVEKVKTFFSNFANTGAFSAVGNALQAVAGAFGNLFSALSGGKGDWTDFGTTLGNIVTKLAEATTAVANFIGKMDPARLQSWALTIASVVGGFKIFNAVTGNSPVTSVLGAISDKFGILGSKGQSESSKAGSSFGLLGKLFQGIGELIQGALNIVVDTLTRFVTGLAQAANSANPAQWLSFGAAMVMLGGGVMLAANGISTLVDAAIRLGEAGSSAGIALGGLVAAIGLLAGGFALLGPSLNAGAIGMVAFGASILMIGAGLKMAAPAFDKLGTAIAKVVKAISGGLTTILGGVSGVIDSIGHAALNAGKGFNQLATGVVKITNTNLGDLAASMGAVALGIGKIASHAAGLSGVSQGLNSLGQIMYQIRSAGTNTVAALNSLTASLTRLPAGAQAVSAAFINMQSQVQGAMQGLLAVLRNVGNQMQAQMRQTGQMSGQALTQGFQSQRGATVSTASATVNAVVARARAGVGPMQQAGAMIGQGLAQGMYSALGSVTAAANALVAQAERAARAKARIHSPSRLFRDSVGVYIGQGVAVGIDNSSKFVDQAMGSMFDNIQNFDYRPKDIIGAWHANANRTLGLGVMAGGTSSTAAQTNQTSNNQYTLNVNVSEGDVDNIDKMKRLFKEFTWYMQQQNGRLGDA